MIPLMTPDPLEQWSQVLANPFFVYDEESLVKLLRQCVRSSDEAWFARIFRWWASRQVPSLTLNLNDIRAEAQSPPQFTCPFPMHQPNKETGLLAFARAFLGRPDAGWPVFMLLDPQQDALNELVIAAGADQAEFRFILPSGISFEGTSFSLAALVALLSTRYQLPIPDSFAATGAWNIECSAFCPVAPETLPTKLAALRAWGYRDLLVVQGQQFPDRHSRDLLRLHWVRPAAREASDDIVRAIWPRHSVGREHFRQQDYDAVRPRFAGRRGILERINAWRDERCAPMFWIHGPSGIGKSQILSRLLDSLPTDRQEMSARHPVTEQKLKDPARSLPIARNANGWRTNRSAFKYAYCRPADFESVNRFYQRCLVMLPAAFRMQRQSTTSADSGTQLDVLLQEVGRGGDQVHDPVRPLLVLVIDGLDGPDEPMQKGVLNRAMKASELGVHVLVSSQNPPAPCIANVIPIQVLPLQQSEIRLMIQLVHDRDPAQFLRVVQSELSQVGAVDAVDRLSHLLSDRTHGLPIYIDKLCDRIEELMSRPAESSTGWIPATEQGFVVWFAQERIANRVDTANPLVMATMAILAEVRGAVPEDAIVGALRALDSMPGLRAREVLRRLRFAVNVTSYRGLCYHRVSHPLVADAMRSCLGADAEAWAVRIREALASWCGEVATHRSLYALIHGPRILASVPAAAQRLGALVRDETLTAMLRARFRGNAERIASFASAGMCSALERSRIGEAVEFAMRVAQLRADSLEDVGQLLTRARLEPRRMGQVLQRTFDRPDVRKLAALIVCVRLLVERQTPAGEITQLLLSFFGARHNRAVLSSQYRDACIPLMAGVLSLLAARGEDLALLVAIFRQNLDWDKAIKLAEATTYQSACHPEGDRRTGLYKVAEELACPPPDETFPVQVIVKALLRVGTLEDALTVLGRYAPAVPDKEPWVILDIMHECACRHEYELAYKLKSKLERLASQSKSSMSTQLLMARAAFLAASPIYPRAARPLFDALLYNCDEQLNARHRPKTKARIAYYAARSGCIDWAHQAIRLAFAEADSLQQLGDRVNTCLRVATEAGQLVEEGIPVLSDTVRSQLEHVGVALAEWAGSALLETGTHLNEEVATAVRTAQANLAKVWAHYGDLDRAYAVLFRTLPRNFPTAGPLRGEALAEIAMRAADASQDWRWVTERNHGHRLTVVSRVLGRLCQTSRFWEAIDLGASELTQVVQHEGAKVWARSLLAQAASTRRAAREGNSTNLPPSVGKTADKRMWCYLNSATLASASCGTSSNSNSITQALRSASEELKGWVRGEEFAELGYHMCRFGHDGDARCLFERAIACLDDLNSQAQLESRLSLVGELLEKLSSYPDETLLDGVEVRFWRAAGTREYASIEHSVCNVAYHFARSTVLNNHRVARVRRFLAKLRTKLRLAPGSAGIAALRAAEAILLAAEGRRSEAESLASSIGKVDARSSAFGDIAAIYLTRGQIDDACRISAQSLQGKQLKNLLRLVLLMHLSPADRGYYFRQLLPAASRFLPAVAWAAAGLIVVDPTITDEEVERILAACDGVRQRGSWNVNDASREESAIRLLDHDTLGGRANPSLMHSKAP